MIYFQTKNAESLLSLRIIYNGMSVRTFWEDFILKMNLNLDFRSVSNITQNHLKCCRIILVLKVLTSSFSKTLSEKWWILKNEIDYCLNLNNETKVEIPLKFLKFKTEYFHLNSMTLFKTSRNVQMLTQRCLSTTFQWWNQDFTTKHLVLWMIKMNLKTNRSRKLFKILILNSLSRSFVKRIFQWLMIQDTRNLLNRNLRNRSQRWLIEVKSTRIEMKICFLSWNKFKLQI